MQRAPRMHRNVAPMYAHKKRLRPFSISASSVGAMTMRPLLVLSFLVASAAAQAKAPTPPVIDMHLHAFQAGPLAGATSCPGSRRPFYVPLDPRHPFIPGKSPACTDPFHAALTDEALMRDTIAMLKKYNVRHAVTSGDLPDVSKWRAAAPDRIIPAIAFADDVNKF